MNVKRLLKKNKGASLLEVLIATAIFSVAFLSFISVQIGSLETVRDGFVKKMITDSSNDFVTQMNTDISSQKVSSTKTAILNFYNDSSWNLDGSDCPITGDLITNCYKNDELDNKDICTKEERIDLMVGNFQCNLIQNIPSARANFVKCSDESALHCLIVSWNGESNSYENCKELDSSCLMFEVLP